MQGQNYRDQKKLIRLKPNNLLVFGKVLIPSGESISSATVSLFDPSALKIIETIPVDDLGEYLFILEKEKTFGLIIEKEGFFPFYSQFTVPTNFDEEWENLVQLPDGLQNRYKLFYPSRSTTPANTEVLDELLSTLSGFNNLMVWIPDEEDSIFPLRLSRIKDSFLKAGIELHRLFVGSAPGNIDQFIHLQLISESPLDDQGGGISQEEKPSLHPLTTDKWTLQFVASKNMLQQSDLKGISDFKLFKGKDGYYRYTYGTYNSKEEADTGKAYLMGKGFNQTFAKKIEDLQKL